MRFALLKLYITFNSLSVMLVLFYDFRHGSLSSWVISHQASLREWTFDKDAKMYEKQSFNHSTISEDLVNVRYHDSNFEDFSFSNLVNY